MDTLRRSRSQNWPGCWQAETSATSTNIFQDDPGFADALAWVEATLHYEKNDELELLSTVDFAALDLLNRGQAVDSLAVKQVIAAHPDWAPKLDRAIFSDANIVRALGRLKAWFPATYS
jgi:hypothetical protein